MTDGVVQLLRQVRLLHPWMGAACLAVVAAVAAALWFTRTRHLPWRRQLAAPLAGAGTGAACWLVVDCLWRPFADGVGGTVWLWVALTATVVVQVLLGGDAAADRARVRERKRRMVRAAGSGVSITATVAAACLAVNAFFAAYPSAAAVLGMGVATTPLASLPAAAALPRHPERGQGALEDTWQAPAAMPQTGAVVTATIPAGDQSGTDGFTPRDAYIYLPPAYLTPQRPALPVLVLLTGQPGSPSDWFELGGLKDSLDAYAAAHAGLAPVVVVADLLGSPYRNPLCADTVRGGKVATYLERDVPAWIRAHLQVDDDAAHWAIGGLSNGGTCALQAVTRSPQVYPTFLAMSAEEHPTLGSEQRTIDVGFDGDRAAYEANDPLSLLAAAPAGSYAGVAGVLSVGTGDDRYAQVVPTVADAAMRAGMSVTEREYPGGHTWAVWSAALRDQLDWLGQRLALTA
ncbi:MULTISPECIES: alpha/beta hydrolase family protein [unclassified Actinomyces]|uniref:alpha/beta hydrolase n=1 Tax=unclassified Actinomyces TaxID=2609248 RepID=UPI000D5A1A70|nr:MULTISPECIES: alpha/beta hydrolase-fold protein [unclassified Actinomyces]RAX24190.1 esterase [Actinomyces sp. Z3]